MRKGIEEQFIKLGLKENQKVLLAVSGGVDSMVLWHLVEQLELNYAVAHVNFSLRGQESDLDEKLVHDHAIQRKVPLHVKKVDTEAYAKLNQLSTQMAAREIRYDFFEQLKKEKGYKTLVTAHHLEDSIETFFINLDRGTGLKGLTGIRSTPERFRPMLHVSKADILTYAKEHHIAFREDQSNASVKYQRNWFRHEIIPAWKKRNPNFVSKMGENLSLLKESHEMWEDFMQEATKELRTQLQQGFLQKQAVLAKEKPKAILVYLLSPYGYHPDQIRDVLVCLEQKQVGRVFLSEEYTLLVDREKLLIEKRKEEEQRAHWLLEEECEIQSPIQLQLQKVKKDSFPNNKNTELFNVEALSFPLCLRRWREGDRMRPLGMKGMKKVSDILIDEKIPLTQKKEVYVVTSKEEIVWLVGIRPDDRFKLEKRHQTALQMSVTWK